MMEHRFKDGNGNPLDVVSVEVLPTLVMRRLGRSVRRGRRVFSEERGLSWDAREFAGGEFRRIGFGEVLMRRGFGAHG